MTTTQRLRCQAVDERSKKLCSKPVCLRIVAVDPTTGREIRGSTAYACLDHGVPLAGVIIPLHPGATIRIIELPNAEAELIKRESAQAAALPAATPHEHMLLRHIYEAASGLRARIAADKDGAIWRHGEKDAVAFIRDLDRALKAYDDHVERFELLDPPGA